MGVFPAIHLPAHSASGLAGEGAERAEHAPCWGAAAVGTGTPGAAGSLYQNHLRCQGSQAPFCPRHAAQVVMRPPKPIS